MATSRSSAPLLGYVLHRYDWSETSLIVELFTRAQGRLVVAAKGAKRPTSQLRPVLLPFNPIHAFLGKPPADAHAEVHLLRSAEWVGSAPLLGAASMHAGFYVNELILKLVAREDPHPRLFDAYADAIAALAVGEEESAVLRAFEMLLLRELGWLPELSTSTLTTLPVRAGVGYTLDAEAGLTERSGGLPGETWALLEATLTRRADDWTALRAVCAPVAGALRGPLRELLHYHLGQATLRTRQVWQGVQRLASTAPHRR
jgi:DNA repair protein RecO (recombination protein O)